MATERSKVRHAFCETYGDNCQNVDRYLSLVSFFWGLIIVLWLRIYLLTLFSIFPFSALRHCFEPGSSFLRQFLFFFKAQNSGDFVILVETCRLLQKFAHSSGISNIYACFFC